MQMAVKTVGDVQVLAILGKLDTHTSPEAQDRLIGLIDDGAKAVLVDLKELEYISSIGFRVFLMAAKRLRSEDGTLRICGINGNVKEVFDISGFTTVFDIYDDEAAALADF
ncbi:MAG: anti-sigma factor antagonist [Alphaproteobacteria bacterium]|nr:anti-sigma factor antagonist [Alphaproteobacteria bacterium]